MVATPLTWMSLELLFFNLEISWFVYMFYDVRKHWKASWKWIYVGWNVLCALMCVIFAIVFTASNRNTIGARLIGASPSSGRYDCSIWGIALLAVGLAIWAYGLIPDIDKTQKSIVAVKSMVCFSVAFILNLVAATLSDNYASVAAMLISLFLLTTWFTFWSIECEYFSDMEKWGTFHLVFSGLGGLFSLLTFIFAIVGAANAGNSDYLGGHIGAANTMLNVSYIFTALVCGALGFSVLWFHVWKKELNLGDPAKDLKEAPAKDKPYGYWVWMSGSALVGVAALLCFIAFCMSFA